MIIFLLMLGNYACGSSDDLDAIIPKEYAVQIEGCEQYYYGGCDITLADCQQNILGLVQCLRQTSDASMPPVRMMTSAEYKQLLTDNQGDENSADLRRFEIALSLLGLAAPGDLTHSNQIELLTDTVTAYYSVEDKNITIITPEEQATTSDQQKFQTQTLAHELVHALQDQEHDLIKFYGDHNTTTDAYLASLSVVEGEAELYQTFLEAAFDGIAQKDANFPRHFQNAADYIFQFYETESPFLIAPRIFPYYYGGRYAYYQWKDHGPSGMASLFTNPPEASVSYIMSETAIVTVPLIPIDDAAPEAVTGATLFAEDTFGAWLTYQYLKSIESSTTNAPKAVGGWRGDRLWIYNDGSTENIAVIWRVRWSNSDQANTCVEQTNWTAANISNSPDRQAFANGSDAIIVAVSGSFVLNEWLTVAQTGVNGNSMSGTTVSAASARKNAAAFIMTDSGSFALNEWLTVAQTGANDNSMPVTTGNAASAGKNAAALPVQVTDLAPDSPKLKKTSSDQMRRNFFPEQIITLKGSDQSSHSSPRKQTILCGLPASGDSLNDNEVFRPGDPRWKNASINQIKRYPDRIKQKIISKMPTIQACADHYVGQSSRRGKVVVKFTIGADGKIADYSIRESNLNSQVAECIVRNLKTISFPGPSEGQFTVNYPFFFEIP
jgi:TonB family protein